MQVVSTIQGLRDALSWRRSGASVGLVVTKGNLHQGHTALIGASLAHNAFTIVTSYAGPNLFFDQESYQRYPHNAEQDQDLLADIGVDVLFKPVEGELYPRGYRDLVRVGLPRIGIGAAQSAEHGYSTELLTLLLKLCHIVQPQTLVYGEKHFQQLFLTELMLRDFNLPTRVHRVPVVRDTDGLAIATRNQQLSAAERQQAPILYRTLSDVGSALQNGARSYGKLEQTARVALRGAGLKTDYLWICDAETLEAPTADTLQFRIMGAAWIGGVRLLDNIALRVQP
ncbi:MAG: pantoate--beta-alanine ligase [Pseudomonadota bacterium]